MARVHLYAIATSAALIRADLTTMRALSGAGRQRWLIALSAAALERRRSSARVRLAPLTRHGMAAGASRCELTDGWRPVMACWV